MANITKYLPSFEATAITAEKQEFANKTLQHFLRSKTQYPLR